jgi:hypothetical protein
MSRSNNRHKVQQEIRRITAHIRPDPRTTATLAERDHLHELFLRLVPIIYAYPALSLEEILRGVDLKLPAAEARFLADRLGLVRKKQDVVVVSKGDEDVLLPLRPGFDPRELPLAALWTDAGYYTPKERSNANETRLRKLGLRDGVTGYASFRALILNPAVGRPAWLEGPLEIAPASSYEAEAVAVELGLLSLVTRLEKERNLPPVDQFQVVLFSDCQSLITALKKPPPPPGTAEAAAATVDRLRDLAGLFAGFHPEWEIRRRIKQRLGH